MLSVARRCSWLVAAAAVYIPALACTQTPPAELGSARTLERDVDSGGPAGVEISALGPLFESEALNEALIVLGEGTSRSAIDQLELWLAENPNSELHDEATFAYAFALYTGERWADALPALETCQAEAPLFGDYCMYWAAEAALELGEATTAAAYAAVVAPDAVMGPRAQFLRGRALMAAGDWATAVQVLQGFVTAYPGAWYRNDVEFALAEAYVELDDVGEAARTYHHLALVNPGTSVETEATAALAVLAASEGDAAAAFRGVNDRTAAETLERGRVLFDRHRSDEVIDLLRPVLTSAPAGSSVYCEAAYLVGKSYSKLRQHSNSLPYYTQVVDDCTDPDLVVKALYNAGRGAWNADDDAAAVQWFERLWTEHADNSYADDAMLLAARVYRGNDEEDAYVALLNRQIAEFGSGDMLKDAVWLLASRLYDAEDYRGLVTFVDGLGSRTGENDIYSRGRLGYFRARSLEQLSLQNEARSGYTAVVRDNPMAYYALLALNRLQNLDAPRAAALVDELAQDNSATEGMIQIRPEAAARDGAFLRGRAMLRMGFYELAEGEFGKLRSRFANEDEIGWVVSLMYHHAGAFQRSHHVPGERQDLNLAYPAPSNMERWQVAYPTPYAEEVAAAATERGLDRYWVYAIMREESGFRADIESWANARGLLQLMEGTANDMAALTGRGSIRARDLFDPEINIELGTMFMRTLADRFDSHPCLIFAGYNGGHGNVNSWLRARGGLPLDEWVEEIPYEQTRNYVKRVTMTWWVYHWLDGNRLPLLGWDLSDML